MRKWSIEMTKEDVMNISKWMTATGMMIEAKFRTPYSDSELATWQKLKPIYYSSEQNQTPNQTANRESMNK